MIRKITIGSLTVPYMEILGEDAMMEDKYVIDGEKIVIETKIPLHSLMEMEIKHHRNEHGSLKLCAIINHTKKEEIFRMDWTGTDITVLDGDTRLFCGQVSVLEYWEENGLLLVKLTGLGKTFSMDVEKKKRTFQNIDMTYKEVVEEVIKKSENVKFIWKIDENRKIGEPIVQYEETDWEFLKRLCSHLQSVLIGEIKSSETRFYFGMLYGKSRDYHIEEIEEIGVKDICRKNKRCTYYLRIKTKEYWELGDFISYEGRQYYLYSKSTVYKNGELINTYEFDSKGRYCQEKIYNPLLAGIRLEGVVRKVEGESVYVQLDIDQEESARFPWRWAPETNNLSYCMPETGTKVTLYFATEKEEDGQVTLSAVKNQNNSIYANTQNREFVTMYDKKLGLYPEKLFLEGKDKNVSITLDDGSGIQMRSNGDISFTADGQVYFKGEKVSVTAPLEVSCRTKESNIELCRDINLYSPVSVNLAEGEGPEKTPDDTKYTEQDETVESWRFSFSAISAIPAVDFAQMEGSDAVTGMFACGSIPKIAQGQTTFAMAEVMGGTKESECSFPKTFCSMQNDMVKGGYALPED